LRALRQIAASFGFTGTDLAGWVKLRCIENSELQAEAQRHAEEIAALRQEWRPMETAPRDGTYILVRWASSSVIYVYAVQWEKDPGAWWDDGCDSSFDDEQLAGWLPLPPLPKEVERHG
jgi:hypothetical protein